MLQVGDDSCRTSEITSKPLLMYNREAGKKKKTNTAVGDGAGDNSEANNSDIIKKDANNDINTNDPVGAGAGATVAQ